MKKHMGENKSKLPIYEVEFIPLERRLASRRKQNKPVAVEQRKGSSRRGPEGASPSSKEK
ncbi:MAG TPA: hypothetical protein VHE58_02065 [Burkholderiales bacterium]|nr:hypothetical protein [Burkholderiales bacterium]